MGWGKRMERVHRVCVSVPADGHAAVSAGSGFSYAAMRPRQHKPCHEPYRADDHHRVARARYQQVRRLHGGNQETHGTQLT